MPDPENAGNEAADPAEVAATDPVASTDQPAADPEVAGINPEPGIIERGLSALGMGGDPADDAVPGVDNLDAEGLDVPEPIVTDEDRELEAANKEQARKKGIRKNSAANLAGKTARIAETQAGRRNTKEQPDFEDHSKDNAEVVTEE